jgi:hypothetical protein
MAGEKIWLRIQYKRCLFSCGGKPSSIVDIEGYVATLSI